MQLKENKIIRNTSTKEKVRMDPHKVTLAVVKRVEKYNLA